MDKKLELQLVEKYPKILKDYGGDRKHTCMAFGIETDNGWYELLDKCMNKLQYFCDLCSNDGREVQVVANQIKEKLATLAFYVSVYNATNTEESIIDSIIFDAERRSAYTCEITGKDGSLCNRNGWYKTLCYEEARKGGYVACNESTESYWKRKDANNSNDESTTN